jgi:flagellar protein FlaG
MSVHVGHLSLVEPADGSAPASVASRPAAAADQATPTPAVRADVIPASPPPEVADEVAAAFLRAAQLADAGRELHFAEDPGSGRIVVEVRDLDGTVVRTIAPSEALDIMSGLSEPC